MAILQNGFGSGEAGFYPKEIEQSLRFNDDDSAYLSWTPASAGNRKTWTFSAWVKRGNLDIEQWIFDVSDGATVSCRLILNANNTLDFYTGSPSVNYRLNTAQLLRDTSSWYHIVISMDTTQATAADRLNMYINGEHITSFSTETYGAQNYETSAGDTFTHQLSGKAYAVTEANLDGYLADVHFTDGTAYDATAFGEFKNGVWVAKEFAGTYGTNGFYLDFADGGALGNDVSGNNNDWTPTNLASTDVMLDSPTNNFATLNPSDEHTLGDLSQGNLQSTNYGTLSRASISTMGVSTGKWYYEYYAKSITSPEERYATSISSQDTRGTPFGADSVGYSFVYGDAAVDGSSVATGTTAATGDIIGMSFDLDSSTNNVSIYKNGTLIYTVSKTFNGTYFPTTLLASSNNSCTSVVNFGQDSSFAGNKVPQGYTDANGYGDFYYAPPTGYLALCTANLPEPAIGPNSASTSDEHFNTVLWSGDGTSPRSITGVGFQPDLSWIKGRGLTSNHNLIDAVRGANKNLSSNLTNAENTSPTNGSVTSFDSDGFTLGSGTFETNDSRMGYAAWNWKANGSGVTNTDGSITSTVSANVDAGFSIVSYTGNGTAGATIGHGLSQAPDMYIVKSRDVTSGGLTNWRIYHKDLGATKNLIFTTSAELGATNIWNDTAPTSSVFSVGTHVSVNDNTYDYIALCWHEVEGFSKVFSYTGNGSSDGPFINLNFKPALIVTKRVDSTGNWIMQDNKRDENTNVKFLYPNLSNAEDTGTLGGIDFLSNGFKVTDTWQDHNANGGQYIGIAFAENPFKYSTAK